MRKLFTFLLFTLFLCTKGWSQEAPVNDDCSGAVALSCNGGYTGDNRSAQLRETLPGSDCGSDNTNWYGVWFTYTATTSGSATFYVVCNGWRPCLRVYSGTCGSFTCITNNIGSNQETTVSTNVVQGTTYYILLTGAEPVDYGEYDIYANCQSTLFNDDCSSAITLSCNSSYSSDNTLASDETLPASTCGETVHGKAKGVWFKYTASTSGSITFSTVGGAAWDTYLRVYSGNCSALTCVGYNDDTSFQFYQSSVTINATAGATYYILLAGYNADSYGTYTLTTTCVCKAHITNQPISATYCPGVTAAPLSVTATGYVASYQWYANTKNSTAGGTPVGTSDSTYIPPTITAGTAYYYVVVNGGCNKDTSAVAVIKVSVPSVAALTAAQTSTCYGAQVLLTASAQGGAKPYRYNFINTVTGASTGYSTLKTKNEPAGSYVAAVQNASGCIDTSDISTITQPASPIAVTTAVINGVCGGKGAVKVSASGGYSSFVYTISSGAAIGKTTPYTFTYLPQGSYTITAIDANGCTKTKTVAVGNTTKVPGPANFTGSTTVTAGSVQTYSVDSIDGISNTWTVPADATILSGQGTATVTIQWGYISGKIKIVPHASCGDGAAKQYSIIVTHTLLAKTATVPPATTNAGTGNISVHPNPVSSIATLVLNSAAGGKYVVDVTDVRGKTLLRKEVTVLKGTNEVTLNVTTLAGGLYLINVFDGNTIQSLKLVKAQ